MKRARKAISILVTLAMLIGLLLPAGSAFAADMYKCPNPQTVSDDSVTSLGALFIEVPAGIFHGLGKDSIEIELGKDFDIVGTADKGVANDTTHGVFVVVPTTFKGDTNGLSAGDIAVTLVDQNKLTITVNNASGTAGDPSFLNVYFNKVDIAKGASGDIKATISGFGGFVNGSVVIGTVAGGAATVSIKDKVNLSGDGQLEDITIMENIAGALKDKTDSVKLILPSGFEWAAGAGTVAVSGGFSTGNVVRHFDGKDTLRLAINTKSSGTKGKIVLSNLNVIVDESKASYGDVKLRVRGSSDLSPKEIVVAKYAEYGLKVEVDGSVPTAFAGQYEQEIADFKITEDASGSLVNGRSVTLKLPANAKWLVLPNSVTDSGVTLNLQGWVGSDYRTVKYTVSSAPSSDAAELTFEDMEVALEPGVTGDLKVEVGGTAGVKGTLTVAKVVNPVSVSVNTVSEVKIGAQSQVVADIIVKEAEEGAIVGDKSFKLELPSGVTFSSTPKVEVVEGDIDLDDTNIKRANNDRELLIPVDKKSNDASTLKITGVKLTVDRTVAEGPVEVKVKGDAVVQVNDLEAITTDFPDPAGPGTNNILEIDVDGNGLYLELARSASTGKATEGFFPNTTTAVKFVIAKVVTPAADAGAVVFNIGSTVYSVGGVTKVMDVAPYIKDSRTYVPVRYMALALGVAENDIAFENGVVTLKKGDVTLKLTIGDKTLMKNDAAVAMDVAPEIVNGRTMLPARFVAEGFGAMVGFANGQVVISQ